MQIKQAIQSSANVIRVTSITAGDVYKRFDSTYDDRVYYGIVRNVHNDGEVAVVEALEYMKQYGNIDINLKVIRGDKDYSLFPADPGELECQLQDVVDRKERDIIKKQEEIKKLTTEIAEMRTIITGEAMRDLKSMSYKELTQGDYNAKKLELVS